MSFLVSLLCHRSEEEGSEETMDTESQQRSTLSNEVYKQVLKSARKQVFCKLPIVVIAVSATWQFFYGCERSNAFNKKSVIFALKSFCGNIFFGSYLLEDLISKPYETYANLRTKTLTQHAHV